MDRARKVLPEGSWEALDAPKRRLLLRAAWVMSEADGIATPEQLAALERAVQGYLAKDLSRLTRELVSQRTLPEDLRNLVTGQRDGQPRFTARADGDRRIRPRELPVDTIRLRCLLRLSWLSWACCRC